MVNLQLQEILMDYPTISRFVRTHSEQEIITIIAAILGISAEKLSRNPMGGYSKGGSSGAYEFVLKDLKKNIDHYDWVYDHLCDDRSRVVFTHLLQFRILPSMNFIKAAFDPLHPQYFDDELIQFDENEVFADCGGFEGETAKLFIERYKNYKHIYIYEPEEKNARQCVKNLEKYVDVTVRCCGVGERSARLGIRHDGASSSFMHGGGEPQNAVQVVSLDEDIQEKLTFIKMDIEGFEIPALLGAKNHIMHDRPKLAVCLYHVVSDIWEIPRLIHLMNPEYSFHIRHYDAAQNWETVLYAIPRSEIFV